MFYDPTNIISSEFLSNSEASDLLENLAERLPIQNFHTREKEYTINFHSEITIYTVFGVWNHAGNHWSLPI